MFFLIFPFQPFCNYLKATFTSFSITKGAHAQRENFENIETYKDKWTANINKIKQMYHKQNQTQGH